MLFRLDGGGGVSGCASWGTCGVLCAIGVSQPHRRFILFLTAIALVLLDLAQPYSSAFGALGGLLGAILLGSACDWKI